MRPFYTACSQYATKLNDSSRYFKIKGLATHLTPTSNEVEQIFPGLLLTTLPNFGEWLLADAELDINGTNIPANDLILGKSGPLLTTHGREWLEELRNRPLSLYEVREVVKGQSLLVADLVHPELPLVTVREKTATGFLALLGYFWCPIGLAR